MTTGHKACHYTEKPFAHLNQLRPPLGATTGGMSDEGRGAWRTVRVFDVIDRETAGTQARGASRGYHLGHPLSSLLR